MTDQPLLNSRQTTIWEVWEFGFPKGDKFSTNYRKSVAHYKLQSFLFYCVQANLYSDGQTQVNVCMLNNKPLTHLEQNTNQNKTSSMDIILFYLIYFIHSLYLRSFFIWICLKQSRVVCSYVTHLGRGWMPAEPELGAPPSDGTLAGAG